MATNLFNRYIWLVDTINRAERITFEEINNKWLRTDWSEGQKIPLRTFHNHRTKIEELFDINIDCDGYNQYFIATDMDNGLRKWLLNTFTVNNLIHESYSLKNRILFEEIPSGELFLTTIIEAMRDGVALKFHYKPFWNSEIPDIEIEPYCVKIFKQRWYVLGYNAFKNDIRIYALDRIQSITTTNTKFKLPKNFDVNACFENAFGIFVSPKIELCVIKLKVFGNRVDYFKTLPLHHSQQEVESNEKYTIFEYYIAPTSDFKQEILSYGNDIEVLSPESFRNEIVETINKMKKLYKIMSTLNILGYSERGIINSIVFFLREQPIYIQGFLKVLGITDDFFNDVCEYTFLNEQSFSDFGSNDWTIIAKKNEEKRVVFIEAKRGKSYKIEEEFKKMYDYLIENKEYGGVSSNIFAQLYYKFLLTQIDDDNEFKNSKIGKEVKKLGGNEVVKKAYREYIKDVSKEQYYYVSILPKEVNDFSEKLDELEISIPNVKSVEWKKIVQFFTNINATTVIENFNFNKGQIY